MNPARVSVRTDDDQTRCNEAFVDIQTTTALVKNFHSD